MPFDVYGTRSTYLHGQRTALLPARIATTATTTALRVIRAVAPLVATPLVFARTRIELLAAAFHDAQNATTGNQARGRLEQIAGVRTGELTDARLLRRARAAAHPDRRDGAMDLWRQVAAAAQLLEQTAPR